MSQTKCLKKATKMALVFGLKGNFYLINFIQNKNSVFKGMNVAFTVRNS